MDDLISFKLMQEDGQMTNAGVLFADQWNYLSFKGIIERVGSKKQGTWLVK